MLDYDGPRGLAHFSFLPPNLKWKSSALPINPTICLGPPLQTKILSPQWPTANPVEEDHLFWLAYSFSKWASASSTNREGCQMRAPTNRTNRKRLKVSKLHFHALKTSSSHISHGPRQWRSWTFSFYIFRGGKEKVREMEMETQIDFLSEPSKNMNTPITLKVCKAFSSFYCYSLQSRHGRTRDPDRSSSGLDPYLECIWSSFSCESCQYTWLRIWIVFTPTNKKTDLG